MKYPQAVFFLAKCVFWILKVSPGTYMVMMCVTLDVIAF